MGIAVRVNSYTCVLCDDALGTEWTVLALHLSVQKTEYTQPKGKSADAGLPFKVMLFLIYFFLVLPSDK